MSLVDHETLKANYESLAEKLANDPDAGLMRPYVSTRLIENVSVESTFVQYDKEYTFYGDEAKSRAGFERVDIHRYAVRRFGIAAYVADTWLRTPNTFEMLAQRSTSD